MFIFDSVLWYTKKPLKILYIKMESKNKVTVKEIEKSLIKISGDKSTGGILDDSMKKDHLSRLYFWLLLGKSHKYGLLKENLLLPADKERYKKDIKKWRKSEWGKSARGRKKTIPPKAKKYTEYENLLYEFSNTKTTDKGKQIINPIGVEFLKDLGIDENNRRIYAANMDVITAFLRYLCLFTYEFEWAEKRLKEVVNNEDWKKAVNEMVGDNLKKNINYEDWETAIDNKDQLNFMTMLLHFVFAGNSELWGGLDESFNMPFGGGIFPGRSGFEKMMGFGNIGCFLKFIGLNRLFYRFLNVFFVKNMVNTLSFKKEESKIRFSCCLLEGTIEQIKMYLGVERIREEYNHKDILYLKPERELSEFNRNNDLMNFFEDFLEYVDNCEEHFLKDAFNTLEKHKENIYFNLNGEFTYTTNPQKDIHLDNEYMNIYKFSDYYAGDFKDFMRNAPVIKLVDYEKIIANYDGKKEIFKKEDGSYFYVSDSEYSFIDAISYKEKTIVGYDALFHTMIDIIMDKISETKKEFENRADIIVYKKIIYEILFKGDYFKYPSGRGLFSNRIHYLNLEYTKHLCSEDFINKKIEDECLFSWEDVPGKDSEKLLGFLIEEPPYAKIGKYRKQIHKAREGWLKNAEIVKSDNNKIININSSELPRPIQFARNKDEGKVTKIDFTMHLNRSNYKCIEDEETGKLMVYYKEIIWTTKDKEFKSKKFEYPLLFDGIYLYKKVKEFESYIKKIQGAPDKKTFESALNELMRWNNEHKKDSVLYQRFHKEIEFEYYIKMFDTIKNEKTFEKAMENLKEWNDKNEKDSNLYQRCAHEIKGFDGIDECTRDKYTYRLEDIYSIS
ncbi:hypothetical protein BEH94_09185 [Candidatus Altiarchaeales archaeon WOR_SM1_SCG]|nr:hypothetical protein BEH94_09185 [Candidatus Altiarchaeales archaeon WOR_SM1_SCG]